MPFWWNVFDSLLSVTIISPLSHYVCLRMWVWKQQNISLTLQTVTHFQKYNFNTGKDISAQATLSSSNIWKQEKSYIACVFLLFSWCKLSIHLSPCKRWRKQDSVHATAGSLTADSRRMQYIGIQSHWGCLYASIINKSLNHSKQSKVLHSHLFVFITQWIHNVPKYMHFLVDALIPTEEKTVNSSM